MIPTRLVAIRRYRLRVFGAGDRQFLIDHDVPAYVKWRGRSGAGAFLMVGENHVERALTLLSAAPPILEERPDTKGEAVVCPYCHSTAIAPRRPHALIALSSGFVVAGVLRVYGYSNTAFGIAALTSAVSTVLFARAAHWRCRSCGRVYGTVAG